LRSFNRFIAKLPAFSGKKIIILPIYVLFMLVAAFSIYQIFDSLPELLYSKGVNKIILVFFPLFGILIVESIGFFLVFQMWLWRDYLKKRYGSTSYQRIFLVGLGGIVWILTVAFNQFIIFYKLSQSFWSTSDLKILATPLDALVVPAAFALFYIKVISGYVCLALRFLMFGRALQIFGFDYLTVVYLYFPEERFKKMRFILSSDTPHMPELWL
jgi:hypothetical protein